jgi:endonuclease YncB( thermonuclease family)
VDGKEQVVRFNHIDCPEKRQAFGTKAKQFVSDRSFNQYVQLVHEGKHDRYKRLLAEVILLDGSNLNKELVANGLAWHFKKYSNNEEYAALELEARQKHVNIWSEEHPIPPWEWRKLRKK